MLSEIECGPEASMVRPAQAAAGAVLVLEGAVQERRGARPATFVAGDCIVVGADARSLLCTGEGVTRCFALSIGAGWAARMGAPVPHRAPRTGAGDAATPWLLAQLCREHRRRELASPAVIRGLALALLGSVTAAPPGERAAVVPLWLWRARERLRARCTEPLRMRDVAAEVGVHPVHLSRAFRRHYGIAASEFVQRRRVEIASRVLARTELPATDVARRSGFAGRAHLARTFARVTGLTPAAYRELLRGG